MSKSIIVNNLSKIYKLYSNPQDRLKEAFHPLKKRYHKEFYALSKVSFEINRGEVVGILGKNGSGKSTILKIIAGILKESSGFVDIKNKVTALLELGAGFNPELSGYENLYLSASIMGFSKIEIDLKLNDIIKFADIGEFLYQPIKMYSSGMKARLGFAMAINVDPEILIIDEALSVGDVAFQRKCYAKIEHMCNDDNVTVLFVSHSSAIVKQLCTRAIMLHKGIKILDGKAIDVVNVYDKFMTSNNINLEELREDYTKLLLNKKNTKEKVPILKSSSFNKSLISKSKVEYQENGAKIENIKVLDSNNQEVNILNFGEIYTYRYEVTFFEDFKDIKFAMFLKSVSGINISGKGVPLEEYNITTIYKGDKYLAIWKFVNIFNDGHYFFNCAVNSNSYGEKVILHRILDAYMIQSLKEEKDFSHGLVDIDINLEIKKI